jgi:hypothetical protein
MPLRNEFGRIAAIAPVLRQSAKPEVIPLPSPSAAAQARVWLTDSSARASVSASGAKADIREGPTRVIFRLGGAQLRGPHYPDEPTSSA